MLPRLDLTPNEVAELVAQAPLVVTELLLDPLTLLAQQEQVIAQRDQTIAQQQQINAQLQQTIDQLTHNVAALSARLRDLEERATTVIPITRINLLPAMASRKSPAHCVAVPTSPQAVKLVILVIL